MLSMIQSVGCQSKEEAVQDNSTIESIQENEAKNKAELISKDEEKEVKEGQLVYYSGGGFAIL